MDHFPELRYNPFASARAMIKRRVAQHRSAQRLIDLVHLGVSG
jgi:hypothetical protein